VLAVIESLLEINQKLLIWITIGFYVLKNFYLVQSLIEKVFVVLDHFKAS
jgi:hypothetical protein